MGTQDFSSRSSYVYAVVEWQPDMARYRLEVEEAIRRGVGDPLTLAEMECALELVDADLVALQSATPDDLSPKSPPVLRRVLELIFGLKRPVFPVPDCWRTRWA